MRVERAGPEDAAAIAALNEYVHELQLAAEPDDFRATTPAEVEHAFAAILDDPSHLLYLAVAGGRPVGYVWAQDVERPANPFTTAARTLYIHHVGVVPDARRSGAGRALVAAVEEEARRRGITRLGLDHWTFNQAAASFFAALGFAPYNVRLRRRL